MTTQVTEENTITFIRQVINFIGVGTEIGKFEDKKNHMQGCIQNF